MPKKKPKPPRMMRRVAYVDGLYPAYEYQTKAYVEATGGDGWEEVDGYIPLTGGSDDDFLDAIAQELLDAAQTAIERADLAELRSRLDAADLRRAIMIGTVIGRIRAKPAGPDATLGRADRKLRRDAGRKTRKLSPDESRQAVAMMDEEMSRHVKKTPASARVAGRLSALLEKRVSPRTVLRAWEKRQR